MYLKYDEQRKLAYIKGLLVIGYLCFSYYGTAQKYIWPDTTQPAAVLRSSIAPSTYNFDVLNSRQNLYQDLLKYHDPILYVSPFPHFSPLKSRNIELREGEGKNGYWLEGQLSHRFIVYRGKYYSNRYLQRLRLTFDIGFVVQMTRDSSSPLLPGNNDVGLGADYLISSMNGIEDLSKPKIWLKAQLHHYSNGQSNSFYLDEPLKRNNYKNGDFSTNYYQLLLQGVKKSKKDALWSAGLGYQKEINIVGPLVMDKELTHSYGRNRILLHVQYVRQPIYSLVNRKKITSSFFVRRQFGDRSEFSLISDHNLSDYPSGKKYRLGWHNYFYYMPWLTNEVGVVVHSFIGRDYLNIRYDDAIWTIQLGMIVKINYKSSQ